MDSVSQQEQGGVGNEESALFDDWQREVEPEEAELLDEEQPAVGDGAREVEVGGEEREDLRPEAPERRKDKEGRRRADMGLPFLAGVSPAGLLSANRKQPGETDHVVKVSL